MRVVQNLTAVALGRGNLIPALIRAVLYALLGVLVGAPADPAAALALFGS